ncbi:hypothetical protein KIW84_051050 [Lathyrus oleraceus]|uniref:Uncharacterized protein n=1 Tax=Pisum sativum TaxID=3888 RepID=A0A9D5AD01_PEA|nr:hypothetical protein KIW84_051050 [Pisum sativum]
MASLVAILWPCLDSTISKPIAESSAYKPPFAMKKSFAQVVIDMYDIPISQLPQSIVKDDRISITVPEEEYLAGLASWLRLEFHETHKDTQEDLLAIQETFVPDFNKSSQSNDDYALSSSDSELVDATQMDNGQEEDVGNKLTSNVQHDMEFLK